MTIADMIIALFGILGSIGSYVQGKHTAKSTNSQLVSDTVNLLSTQIEILTARCEEIPDLKSRIKYLEELATQRAQVEEVREIVERIETRLTATGRVA